MPDIACMLSDMVDLQKQEKRDRLQELGRDLSDAVRARDLASENLRVTVLDALASGVSENEAAKLAGITRDTVRRWAGK